MSDQDFETIDMGELFISKQVFTLLKNKHNSMRKVLFSTPLGVKPENTNRYYKVNVQVKVPTTQITLSASRLVDLFLDAGSSKKKAVKLVEDIVRDYKNNQEKTNG